MQTYLITVWEVPCVIVTINYAVVHLSLLLSFYYEQREEGLSFRYFLWAIKENDKYVLLTLF